jgi:hypothetical protein
VAILAGVIVPVVAGPAKMAAVLVAGIVLDPDPLTAAATYSRGVLHALRTHQRVIKRCQLLHRVQRMTDTTLLQVFQFTHKISSSIKIARSAE